MSLDYRLPKGRVWKPLETGSSGQGRARRGSPTFQQLMRGAVPSLGHLLNLPLLMHVSGEGRGAERPSDMNWG